MTKFTAAVNFVDWPKDSRKDDYYIHEEGMYELFFPSQQPKAKNFRKHSCNVMFPHIRQHLTNKMVDDLIHGNQQTIIGIQREHQLAITGRGNQIRAIQHENLGLQGEIRAKDQEIAAL